MAARALRSALPVFAVAALVALAACGARTPLGVDPRIADSGVTDTYVPDTYAPAEAATACSPAGVACASSAACCPALTCIDAACAAAPAPSCVPDGATCADDLECCTPPCRSGVCGRGPVCQPGGFMCTVGTQCCSSVCGIAGVCTYPSCHTILGQTACDVCVAQSCCPLVQACVAEGQCSSYLHCVAGCELQGINEMACEVECSQLIDQAGSMVNVCAGEYCESQCSEG